MTEIPNTLFLSRGNKATAWYRCALPALALGSDWTCYVGSPPDVQFVYGRMSMSASGAGSVDSQDPQIGFSSTNAAGNIGSVAAPVSGTPAPSYDGAGAAPLANLYNAAGPITVLTSAADGAAADSAPRLPAPPA